MSATRYLSTALLTLAMVLLGIAAINFVVDPYLVFGRERIVGFNQAKPTADQREWLMKAHEAPRHNPRTVVLGSSRADVGISPGSSAWPAAWAPVYNLSLAGSDLGLNLHYLQHLLRANEGRSALRQVVVGLDFESFLARPAIAAAAADPREAEALARLDAMATATLAGRLRVWQDRSESLFTLDALLDSASTVTANRSASPGANLGLDGQFGDGQLRKWTQADGVAQLFRQKNADTLRSFKPPRRSLAPADGAQMHGAPQLAALIELCGRHRLKLVLLIQPSHASRLEMLDAMGYWPEFEHWKQALAALTDDARATGHDVVLWDFSGYEPANLEPMPGPQAARTPLQWYWDPVHYRPALGDRMLATITVGHATPPAALLTRTSVESRLQRVRADREAYRAAQGTEMQRWRQMVCPGPLCARPASH